MHRQVLAQLFVTADNVHDDADPRAVHVGREVPLACKQFESSYADVFTDPCNQIATCGLH